VARRVESSAGDGREQHPLAPNGWPKALLREFRAGARDALTSVYELHAREIAGLLQRGFSFRTAGRDRRFAGFASAFDMQDALHETFRRAFEPRARDGYDGIRPYGPYLRTIARNVVLTRFRGREVLFPDVDVVEVDDDGVPVRRSPVHSDSLPSPERAVHHAQTKELVESFLASLCHEDRVLIECRFVEGLSQRQAAERLGVGRQRLRTREQRVKRKLLEYLHVRGESSLVEVTSVVACLIGGGWVGGIREVLQ